MGELIPVIFGKKVLKSIECGLPPRWDQHTSGKIRVYLTDDILARITGHVGYTDFEENQVCPDYVEIYFPRYGYAMIRKDFIIVDD